MPTRLVLAACVLLAAGCAMQEEKAADGEYKSPVYRTGSNIPAGRDGGQASEQMSEAERRNVEAWRERSRPQPKPAM
jgi:hypothetical protein